MPASDSGSGESEKHSDGGGFISINTPLVYIAADYSF
jgi:hypothetical protein